MVRGVGRLSVALGVLLVATVPGLADPQDVPQVRPTPSPAVPPPAAAAPAQPRTPGAAAPTQAPGAVAPPRVPGTAAPAATPGAAAPPGVQGPVVSPLAPGAPSPSLPPGATPFAMMAADPFAASLFGIPPVSELGTEAAGTGEYGDLVAGGVPVLIGDLGPLLRFQQVGGSATPGLPQPIPPPGFPRPPSPRLASTLAPSVRGFKIAENQSPRPQDRVFFSFNFFNDVNAAINKRFEAPVNHLRAYRYVFGFEKTFDEGRGSFGLRLPLDTLTADSTISGNFAKSGGTSTSLGDLGIFTKYVLKYNPATGSLISAGLLVTPPTGPDTFAGAKYIQSVHSTSIQPFLGYIFRRGEFYLQGFTAVDTPSSIRDVTMIYNDVGIGYFVYHDYDPRSFLTAVAPTFEFHVNTPLTHRDVFNSRDPGASPDVVNLTYGLNFEFRKSMLLTVGVVTPVTGPRPFDYEVVALLNFWFGRTRSGRAPTPAVPPPL